LFVVLLGFLSLWPIILELSYRPLGLGVVRDILLLSWVLAVSNNARVATIVFILGIGVAASRGLFEFGFGIFFDNVSHVLGLIVLVIVSVAILNEVMGAGDVTLHLVVGAVCVYLMLILFWTFLYDAIETLNPGTILVQARSFSATANLPAADANFVKMFYFSMTTITTLEIATYLSPFSRVSSRPSKRSWASFISGF
jgi:hypothetical protein